MLGRTKSEELEKLGVTQYCGVDVCDTMAVKNACTHAAPRGNSEETNPG